MFCGKCGSQVPDGAQFCNKCGQPMGAAVVTPTTPGAAVTPGAAPGVAAPGGVKVPNHLVEAILVTLFCCLPLGIAAIIFAAQVNNKLAAGDVAGAIDASNKAKTLSWISFGCGFVIIAIYVVLAIIGAAGQMGR